MNSIPRRKSPRAPSMALDDALDRVQKAYDKERLHAAPTEVVAQNLGYKGANNGSALAALASLRYYGLLERPKEGLLAVTKEFENFRFAPAEHQRRSLLVSFLRKPQLYAELLEKYVNGLPSEANLKYELIQKGFSPATAVVALMAFQRSVDYVDYFAAGETAATEREPAADIHLAKYPVPAYAIPPVPIRSAAPGVNEAMPLEVTSGVASVVDVAEDVDRIPVRLPGGRRAWLIIPTPFFAADKSRLKAQIDLLLTQDEEAGL